MKLFILSTHSRIAQWRSLDAKLTEIKLVLNSGKGGAWQVEWGETTAVPKVTDGKIDREWLAGVVKPLWDAGYDVVAFHMSQAQHSAWGISPGLRGANPVKGEMANFWFWADEKTLRNGKNQFVQTCLHEFAHEYFQQTGLPDTTHTYHDLNPDITGLFATFDWRRYQPARFAMKSLVTLLREYLARLTAQPTTLLHPVPDAFRHSVTQAYGVNSSRYPRTGRHIGTDYEIPVGTKLRAPWRGRVTAAGTGKDTGHFCHFEYEYDGEVWEERWCHLDTVPALGEYRRGSVVAISGNTGMSTGPHLHREVWKDDVRIDLITRTNWATLTRDPEKHYAT